jgi:hypothetical protein
MANKRKKCSSITAKQSEAHYKNLFCKKAYDIAKVVCTDDAYQFLTPKYLDVVYMRRIRTVKMVAENDSDFTSKDLQYYKDYILRQLKIQPITFPDSDYTINFYDLLGPCLSLWLYLRRLTDENLYHYQKIKDGFKKFVENEDFFNDSFKTIGEITNFLSWQISTIDKRLISIRMNFEVHESEHYFFTKIGITGYKPEVVNVTFHGNTRPAFRVGLTCNGGDAFWAGIKAAVLKPKNFNPDATIPVYIQHHAINRLMERLDCANPMVILLGLVDAIAEPKCIHHNGANLLEFQYVDKVVGYLVVEMFQEIAVIKTFLLLTHASTPQSEKLREIIGLEKHDINYLNLDKLSTFVHSDLRDNQLLRDIFTRAGCQALLEVKKFDFDKQCIAKNISSIESYFYKYQEYTKKLELPELELEVAG